MEVIKSNKTETVDLIQYAIDKQMPVETIEKLLTMRRELKEEWAKEEFYKALSAFQKECPEILKDKIVYGKDGKIRYKYASLDSIIKQTKELLAKYGFSYNFQSEFEADAVIVKCVLSHVAGHQESAYFKALIEKESFMSGIQRSGAAMTYAKRYSFLAVTGIMTADEDVDGVIDKEVDEDKIEERIQNSSITEPQLKKIAVLFNQLGIDSREERIEIVKDIIDREVDSSRELTKAEASLVISELIKKVGNLEEY